jgi:N-acetylglucosaminyl-diphospho-decaprenol L-rhamnosyltransferase
MHGHVDTPRVSVIIATWNAGDVLGACLDSVERQRVAGGLETIVVDNGSTDGTKTLLRRYEGRIRTMTNAHNMGFGAASNLAANAAHGQILFFLNPDTELFGLDVLERLARIAEDPGVGIVGPMLVNPDGTLQSSCARDPSVATALLVGVGAHRLMPDALLALVAPDHWSHDRALDTDWVMGAAIAMRADVFAEVGGFWEMMYAEEQDLAYRVRGLGLRVRFEPAAKVMHVGNHSGSQLWSGAERAARVARAELAFLTSHYGRARASGIRAITWVAYAGRAFIHARLGRSDRAMIYRAMAAEYRGGV